MQDVPLIRVVARQAPLRADEVHDLVLALARLVGVAEDHLDVLPRRMPIAPLQHVEAQEARQLGHEARARRNHIGVPRPLGLGRQLEAVRQHLLAHLLHRLVVLASLLGRLEAPRALLVHLGARRHSVDGQEEQAARPHRVEEPVHVVAHVAKHLLFRLRSRSILRMRARVDDPVHVDVQVVELHAVRIWRANIQRDVRVS
eukprot:scaffold327_cov257-Pinguiococcus_pyrenoidosus.AAC.6